MNNEKLEKIDFIHTKPSKLHPSIYVIFALVLGVIISNFFGIGYFLGILFGILAAALFTYLDYFLISRTLPCPYCNQKVKVKVDWRCDHCHKNQGQERFLSENCVHCGMLITSSVCEHCKKTFEI